jgi:hypothetical protein
MSALDAAFLAPGRSGRTFVGSTSQGARLQQAANSQLHRRCYRSPNLGGGFGGAYVLWPPIHLGVYGSRDLTWRIPGESRAPGLVTNILRRTEWITPSDTDIW